jgi:hypothetical protein
MRFILLTASIRMNAHIQMKLYRNIRKIGSRNALVCNHCEKNSTCRFLHHKENAIEARIVVTTHHQYDHFYQSNELHSWEKDGDRNQRDLFIIDEDIVFSQLYQPINLDYDELKAFVGTITDFLQRYDEIANLRHGIDCSFPMLISVTARPLFVLLILIFHFQKLS